MTSVNGKDSIKGSCITLSFMYFFIEAMAFFSSHGKGGRVGSYELLYAHFFEAESPVPPFFSTIMARGVYPT